MRNIFALSALAALVFQNTALVFAMKLAYRESSRHFHVSATVSCCEACKLCFCSLVVVVEAGKNKAGKGLLRYVDIRYALPSLLYILQTSILFVAVRNLSPVVFIACSQSKILSTVMFSRLYLNMEIQRGQFVSLVCLAAAMVLLQIPNVETSPTTETQTTHLIGLFAVFTAATISGFTSVYIENILKSKEKKLSLAEQNIQLGLLSLPISLLTGILQDYQSYQKIGFFHGFDSVVWAVVFLQSVGGLIVAAVVKFASSISKCYAVSASICLVSSISCMLGLEKLSATGCLGIGMTIVATLLFSREPT